MSVLATECARCGSEARRNGSLCWDCNAIANRVVRRWMESGDPDQAAEIRRQFGFSVDALNTRKYRLRKAAP